ncbi:MAG: MnhB domain-containing protein [Desulfurococcaceae archaeon]
MTLRTFIAIMLLITAATVPLIVTAYLEIAVPRVNRELGLFYVRDTLLGAGSPEAVAAIVWDYRGLDTIYETAVLYLAIVGGLSLFGTSKKLAKSVGVGLTLLARTSTKMIALLIATISVAIALHGHLTPGGGFPGGSALAISTMLIIPVFSIQTVLDRGITSTKLVAIRGLALTGIGLTALLPITKGLEIVTNLRFYPFQVAGLTLSGSISIYNVLEFLAVSSGFTAIALYLSVPEEFYREATGGIYA